jgi:hypothetical protein
MKPSFNIARRTFLTRCAQIAAATGLPMWFVEQQQLEAAQAPPAVAPNDRPGIGVVGCGGMGKADTTNASNYGDILAVCDVDEVHMVYTDFINTIKQEPHVQKLLPVQPAERTEGMAPDYIFEPSPEVVLSRVLYGFTEVQVLQALYESLASEHSARMVAMRNATDAAGELIDDLTLTYNKARQSGITNELMDIIGGTAALESK